MAKLWLYFFAVSHCLLGAALLCPPAAAEMPEQVVERLAGFQLVQGEFEQQQQLADLDYSLDSAGEFVYWRDRGLYMVNREPFFHASTITGDGVIQWREDGSGHRDSGQDGLVQREIGRTLLAFFSADVELIDARFDSQWHFSDKGWADGGWQLVLTPRDSRVRRQISRARLSGDQYLTGLTLEAANGDITTLAFSAIVTAETPSAEQCRRFALRDGAGHCPDSAAD